MIKVFDSTLYEKRIRIVWVTRIRWYTAIYTYKRIIRNRTNGAVHMPQMAAANKVVERSSIIELRETNRNLQLGIHLIVKLSRVCLKFISNSFEFYLSLQVLDFGNYFNFLIITLNAMFTSKEYSRKFYVLRTRTLRKIIENVYIYRILY